MSSGTGTQTDSVTWCEERLRRLGEPLHLARLFTPPASRAQATAIGAIYIELEAIAKGQRDLNVARMKLGWWRDELGRLDTGKPAHPATQLLASTQVSRSIHHLMALITGMELNLLEGTPGDLASACVRSERVGPKLIAALNVQLQPQQPEADDLTDTGLGRGVALARHLCSPLDESIRSEVAASAREDLAAARERLAKSSPAVRVLATLAWQQTRQTEENSAISRGRQRLCTLHAWRAARGKLPRALRTGKRAGHEQTRQSGA